MVRLIQSLPCLWARKLPEEIQNTHCNTIYSISCQPIESEENQNRIGIYKNNRANDRTNFFYNQAVSDILFHNKLVYPRFRDEQTLIRRNFSPLTPNDARHPIPRDEWLPLVAIRLPGEPVLGLTAEYLVHRAHLLHTDVARPLTISGIKFREISFLLETRS